MLRVERQGITKKWLQCPQRVSEEPKRHSHANLTEYSEPALMSKARKKEVTFSRPYWCPLTVVPLFCTRETSFVAAAMVPNCHSGSLMPVWSWMVVIRGGSI